MTQQKQNNQWVKPSSDDGEVFDQPQQSQKYNGLYNPVRTKKIVDHVCALFRSFPPSGSVIHKSFSIILSVLYVGLLAWEADTLISASAIHLYFACLITSLVYGISLDSLNIARPALSIHFFAAVKYASFVVLLFYLVSIQKQPDAEFLTYMEFSLILAVVIFGFVEGNINCQKSEKSTPNYLLGALFLMITFIFAFHSMVQLLGIFMKYSFLIN